MLFFTLELSANLGGYGTMMGRIRRELIGRLAAEFATIVLGVLVALGVDDWRSGRADIDREACFLGSLLEDLEADLVGFQAAHANAQARIAAAACDRK